MPEMNKPSDQAWTALVRLSFSPDGTPELGRQMVGAAMKYAGAIAEEHRRTIAARDATIAEMQKPRPIPPLCPDHPQPEVGDKCPVCVRDATIADQAAEIATLRSTLNASRGRSNELLEENRALKRRVLDLAEYTVHDLSCALHYFQGGRVTDDGYEVNYDGQWYQATPVDRRPECTCGLNRLLNNKPNQE